MNKEEEQGHFSKKKRWKSLLQWFLRLGFTVAAMIFVFKKVDFTSIANVLENAKWGYFILAVLMFLISKIIGSFRLLYFYKACGIVVSYVENIKFYLLGMFYNLFLPGGIGGDGYKIYLLKQNREVKTRKLLSATFLDRLSGMAFLLILGLILASLSSLPVFFPNFRIILLLAASLGIPVLYLLIKWFFSDFIKPFWITNMFSFWVQIGQLFSALFILLALEVESSYVDYLTLFMASSIAFVLPISIGGMGARELVFLYGSKLLNVSESLGVTFAMLFFAATALSALTGIFVAPTRILSNRKTE